MTPPTEQPTHYLQWARRGKPGFFRYLAGALLVLAISLFFGQIFSVVGALLIPSQSVAATIVKTTFFGFIVSFLLIPLVPVLLNRRPSWSIAMPARKLEVTHLALGAGIAIVTMLVLNLVGAGTRGRRAHSVFRRHVPRRGRHAQDATDAIVGAR